MAQGRFFSLDTCQHTVGRMVYQYARIKKTPLMGYKLSGIDPNFTAVYVAQNNDSLMNFIWLVKSPQYAPQSDERVLGLLKNLSRDNFKTIEHLWVPAFTVEQNLRSAGN